MSSNPFFDFRASAFRFVDFTLVQATPVNNRLDEVTDGFDAVNTALGLKAAAASPTFTGTVNLTGATSVLLPDVALAEATMNKAATLQYVQDVLGAAGALLPPQSSHGGQFLGTNGTSASWSAVFPDQSGNVGKVLRTSGSAVSWAASNPLTGGGISTFSASGALSGNNRLAEVTVSTAGLVVTLPDATTMANGDSVWVAYNASASNDTQGLLDSTGELLHTLTGGVRTAFAVLHDNSSAAGTWKLWSAFGSAPAAPAAVGMVGAATTMRATADLTVSLSIGSDQFLVASHKDASNGWEVYVATVSGAAVSIGTVAQQLAAEGATWARLLAVTGGYALIYTTSGTGDLKTIGITVSGTTPTIGTSTTVCASIAVCSAGVYSDFEAVASGATVLVVYRKSGTSLECRAITYTGTSANPSGSGYVISTVTVAGNVSSVGLVAISSSQFLAAYAIDDSSSGKTTEAVTISVSGVVCTVNSGSKAVIGAYGFGVGLRLVSASKALLAYRPDANNLYARTLTISGNTVTANTAYLLFSHSQTAPYKIGVSAVGAYYVCFTSNSSDMKAIVVSESSNVLTVAGSVVNPGVGSAHPAPAALSSTLMIGCPSVGGAGVTLYSVGAGGAVSSIALTAGATLASSSDPWVDSLLAKLSAGKQVLAIPATGGSGDARAYVYRYGGVS